MNAVESSAEAFAKEESDGNSGTACVCKLSLALLSIKPGTSNDRSRSSWNFEEFYSEFYLEFLDSLFLGHPK